MLKYNIDKTAIVDKIKHHEKHNQAKKLNRQLMTKDFLCRLYTHIPPALRTPAFQSLIL